MMLCFFDQCFSVLNNTMICKSNLQIEFVNELTGLQQLGRKKPSTRGDSQKAANEISDMMKRVPGQAQPVNLTVLKMRLFLREGQTILGHNSW